MVGQSRESGIDGHFLSSTRGTSGNKDASVLASEGTLKPETTSGIPEHLSWILELVIVILSIRRGG